MTPEEAVYIDDKFEAVSDEAYELCASHHDTPFVHATNFIIMVDILKPATPDLLDSIQQILIKYCSGVASVTITESEGDYVRFYGDLK